MSLSNPSLLAAGKTSTAAAASGNPVTAKAVPAAASSAAANGTVATGTVSSASTGRPSTLGINVSRENRVMLGAGLTNATTDPRAAQLQNASPFPYTGLDSFGIFINDGQVVSKSVDFNKISSALKAIQSYLSHVVKAAPKDLAARLTGRVLNQIVGIAPNAVSQQGSSGGLRAYSWSASGTPLLSSPVRSPVIVTLATQVTVSPSTSYIATPALALSAAQKTALGITSSISAVKGLGFYMSAKFQAPSGSAFSTGDMAAYDPAALTAQVSALVNDNGSVQLYLSPGVFASSTTKLPTVFGNNPGGNAYPYLASGLWYVYITFVLSTYTWI